MDAQPPAMAPPPTALQLLVDACRAVFDGSNTPPTATAVSFVRGMIDKMGPDEVRFFKKEYANHKPPIITCKTVYECSNFTITVFFVPWGAAMPLFNDPGLTVFSKLLVGSAHVVAYDWVRPRVCAGSGRPAAMLAEKVLDQEFTAASGAWVLLFPDSGGNLHRLDRPCAFSRTSLRSVP